MRLWAHRTICPGSSRGRPASSVAPTHGRPLRRRTRTGSTWTSRAPGKSSLRGAVLKISSASNLSVLRDKTPAMSKATPARALQDRGQFVAIGPAFRILLADLDIAGAARGELLDALLARAWCVESSSPFHRRRSRRLPGQTPAPRHGPAPPRAERCGCPRLLAILCRFELRPNAHESPMSGLSAATA